MKLIKSILGFFYSKHNTGCIKCKHYIAEYNECKAIHKYYRLDYRHGVCYDKRIPEKSNRLCDCPDWEGIGNENNIKS